MSNRWYKEAVVYSLEVDLYQDSNGDGIGDFPGLIGRLDYLSRLGVTCLWLNPIHPSPNRDAGYDVSDYYGVDPRLGVSATSSSCVHEAGDRGLRVLLDLVVNHTSDEHPWFRRPAPPGPAVPRWYVWFGGRAAEQAGTASCSRACRRRRGPTTSEAGGVWYHHRFYDFEPDLNWANEAVRTRDPGDRVVLAAARVPRGFPWTRRRSSWSGAAQGLYRTDLRILDDLREHLQWIRNDAVLLCEANVDADVIPLYTGSVHGGRTTGRTCSSPSR